MDDHASKSQYLEHLQDFNQNQGQVTLSSDVKNDNGVLLASKGERLNKRNMDLMIRHKLSKPLDACIGLAPGYNAKTLRADLEALLLQHPDIAKVLESSGGKQAVPGCLHQMEQHHLIYQKLTLMAHVLREHFERSLLNCVLSLSLAIFSGQPKQDCIKIFTISLIENIGLLHLDPKVTKKLTPPYEFWRKYHAHPLIAQELLKAIPRFPLSIIRGVAQHHERINGTGFPAMTENEDISSFVHYTGIIDELTRLKFTRAQKNETNILELMGMLQFRRQHFPNKLFSNLQKMITQAGVVYESCIQTAELKSFSRLQLFYYSKCMIYCDIIARIADSITTTAPTNSKSLLRLQKLAKDFIRGVFSSGMLSLPIRGLIEDCIEKECPELLLDVVEIDHAHHGILDQIEEIFSFLEYTVNHETLSDEVKNSDAFASLQACSALLNYMREMKSQEQGWKALIEEMYHGENELNAILKSMR